MDLVQLILLSKLKEIQLQLCKNHAKCITANNKK